MDLSLGTTSVPSIPAIAAPREASAPKSAPAAVAAPRSVMLADQVAKSLLMPSSLALAQVTVIVAARRVVFPARYAGADREEKTRNELVRRVKNVVKSEAAGQQTQSRS